MAKTPRIPVSEKPFTWIDTETTGLDPVKNDIIEIAIVRVEMDGTERHLHARVQIERPDNAHPKALEVNGYTPEAWAGAADPGTAWRKIADSGLLSECIVAGQNVRFDAAFLTETFKRHGIDYRMDYHLYDTCTLALAHLKPWVQSVSLVPTCVALDIPVTGAHTALGDVFLAMAVNKVLQHATPQQRAMWAETVPQRLAAWEEAGRPDVWPPQAEVPAG